MPIHRSWLSDMRGEHLPAMHALFRDLHRKKSHPQVVAVKSAPFNEVDNAVQDATRKSLVTATAASSLLGCVIMGTHLHVIESQSHDLSASQSQALQ